MEKQNPDRTISADRRAIADMRRVNVGCEVSQYCPARDPSIESISRFSESMAVYAPGFEVEMAKREISRQLPDYSDCAHRWRFSRVQSFPGVSWGALAIWSPFIA